LKAKANVNANGGKSQLTPLHRAAKEKNKAIAELLLKHGADRGATDAKGQLPWQVAEEAGDKNLSEILKPHL
jgi:ankyrin repeat protein